MTTIQEFNQIDGRISSLYHAAALKMGLSDSEFRILYTLAVNAPGYLQSALREATGMGRSTVNSALKKLEREGILTLSPGSGRHTCVSLTAQGHRLADRTVCRLIRLEDRIYAGWTSEEQALLLRLNRDFTEKLEAIVASLQWDIPQEVKKDTAGTACRVLFCVLAYRTISPTLGLPAA